MKIEKTTLMKALETVKPGLSSKEMIEQSTSFCFKDDKVITYNDEISISYPLKLGITGAINANELYAFLSKINAEELELSEGENEILFKAGRAKAGLKIQAEIKLPIEEVGNMGEWKTCPVSLLKGIGFAMSACSRDMSRPVLTCVQIKDKSVAGSDSYRIAYYITEKKSPVKETLIPASVCPTILRFSPVKIAEGEGWIHFQNEAGAVLSCRIFDDKFPDVLPFLEVHGEALEFPTDMKDLLEKAIVFAKREHLLYETVTLSFVQNKMTIRSESESGWYEERSKTNYAGAEIKFNITPYLLKDIIKETNTGIMNKNQLLFESENWKYLTLLK